MYCPNCSEPKAQDNTKYCTKCGFDLRGLDDVVSRGGLGSKSGRTGIENGLRLILLGLMLVPVWLFIGVIFPPDDKFLESSPSTTWLEQIFWIAMWVLFIAGAARIVLSLAFERSANERGTDSPAIEQEAARHSLPSGEDFRPADPGMWKSTDDFFEPVIKTARTSGELR